MLKNKQKRGGPQRQAVVMLIHNNKRGVLFTKRRSNRQFLPGIWALPSGHIEEGESYQEAVIREAKEELGIAVKQIRLDQVITEPSGDKTKVYLVEILSTNYQCVPLTKGDEFEEIAWMTLKDFYNTFTDEEIGSTLRHLRPPFQK